MSSVWFRLDEAWDFLPASLAPPCVDVEKEARALRFITRRTLMKQFTRKHRTEFRPFTLFGSGDFHHLSSVWLSQFSEPLTLVSFDNHPDWDIRPPHWSCGAWINRAMENSLLEQVSIWGCANFECQFPGRLLGNRRAAQADRLRVHPWAQAEKYPAWLHPIKSETWRQDFLAEAQRFQGRKLYVTLDLDCLASPYVTTNWEQGRFTPDDLVWALEQLRHRAEIVGGDLGGVYSLPRHASFFQALASRVDHPRLPVPSSKELAEKHLAVFKKLWPALLG